MLSPSTLDPADFAAAARAAEAEALSAAGTFGAVLRASPEFTALLAAESALRGRRGLAAIEAFKPPGGAPGGNHDAGP